MHEEFLSFMDLIQIGLTMLACYCCYHKGVSDGIDLAIDTLADDGEGKENG